MNGPRSSRSSIPSISGELSQRRLGVRAGGSNERPVRAQLIVALVVALTLVAAPLYLMRRPAPPESAKPAPEAGTPTALVSSRPLETEEEQTPKGPTLGPAERIRCGATVRRGQVGSLCDHLPVMEQALAKAIRETDECAPRTRRAGTINYVLTVDFVSRALHVFPGASGDFRGPQARRAAACVKRALPKPDWDGIRHQYRHYMIAILASYSPAADEPGEVSPKFE